LLAGFGASHVLGAEEAPAHRERQAVFLSDFLQSVRWPEDAFNRPSDELRVQVVGHDPFNGELDRILAGERVVNVASWSPTSTQRSAPGWLERTSWNTK
jgi:hypothetical protein